MPTRSRNARTKARQKRSMSLLKRGFRDAAFQANRNLSVALMLLAHAGGSVTLSEVTIQSVAKNLGKLQFSIDPVKDGGVIVSMGVAGDALPAEALAMMKQRMDAAHNGGGSDTGDVVPTFVPPANSVTAGLAAERTEGGPADPTDAALDPA